ncbi:hypothetical protein VMF7928_01336 [Vibrio marisflavi CECT 7928]|uniref:HTH arsR-type domain-containing protein n=2 Tax=Vibrio marisflavi TaxID=1216040 RepID=A0ABM9A264_9VIBR|nr:hypothetical protein VMF7928_01336 [Vibrio marisflavi CECT 7928]
MCGEYLFFWVEIPANVFQARQSTIYSRLPHLRSMNCPPSALHLHCVSVYNANTADFARMHMLDYAQLQDNAEQAVSLLKAVGNKHRLMILCILQEGELSVSELNQRIPMPQSTLSQHLSSLRKDKIVSTRRAAQTIYYSLNNANVVELIALLHKLYCK